MDNKSNISLGGTKTLLALLAQKNFFGQTWSVTSKKLLNYKKNVKTVNKKPESCVIYLFSIYCVEIVTTEKGLK